MANDHCRRCWYTVDSGQFRDGQLLAKFVQLDYDQETDDFLAKCDKLYQRFQLQLWHAVCIPILRFFLRQTCINAFLNRGAMFLFSSSHLATLLDPVRQGWPHTACLLDLGAGDGHVTLNFRPYFGRILATDASSFMRQRLKEKGIDVIGVDDWQLDSTRLHLVTCLNLLDRHPQPRTLLRQLYRKSAQNNCPLLLSVVLPWCQYVEYSVNGNSAADETVQLTGRGFEQQAQSLVDQLLQPAGFDVLSFSRLPYLCEGNLESRFFVLHSAVFLLQPVLANGGRSFLDE